MVSDTVRWRLNASLALSLPLQGGSQDISLFASRFPQGPPEMKMDPAEVKTPAWSIWEHCSLAA